MSVTMLHHNQLTDRELKFSCFLNKLLSYARCLNWFPGKDPQVISGRPRNESKVVVLKVKTNDVIASTERPKEGY